MGWTDLFKSKSAKLKPDPRIRWFGKLPTYPDYYRSPADEAWVGEFNEWVLKGVELHQTRRSGTERARPRMPLCSGVIRLPQSGMTVFASILDFGGDQRGRPFPICFYVGFPTLRWPGPTSDRLHGAVRVMRELLDLRREVAWFVNSPGHFETVFGDREAVLTDLEEQNGDAGWMKSGKAVSMADWFAGAESALAIKDQGTWVRLATAWGDNLAQHEHKDFEPTLRLPLARGVPADIQVAGWIRWLETRLDVRRRLLSLVVSGDLEHEPGHLGIIARDVVPDDFLLLTPLANTLPYLDDLSKLKAPEEGDDDQVLAEPSGPATGTPESWTDFVEAAATVG